MSSHHESGLEVPADDVISRYAQELATAIRRALLAEAALDRAIAEINQRYDSSERDE